MSFALRRSYTTQPLQPKVAFGLKANSYSVWQTHFKQAVLEDYALSLVFLILRDLLAPLLCADLMGDLCDRLQERRC